MRSFCLLFFIVLLGCTPSTPSINKKVYNPTINYQVVEIEGKKWIATPQSHGHWSLAGPLEE
jgi:hypothetical protein